uniref:Uncharacterized protein n=1 Tax=Opuntia streptacantha TaxID=393608 RepID=A0A7C9EMC8_OPUST
MAAIAVATPIPYHSRELLLLLEEHPQAYGLSSIAATLLKEAHWTPFLSLSATSSLAYHASAQEIPSTQTNGPLVGPRSRSKGCSFVYCAAHAIYKQYPQWSWKGLEVCCSSIVSFCNNFRMGI